MQLKCEIFASETQSSDFFKECVSIHNGVGSFLFTQRQSTPDQHGLHLLTLEFSSFQQQHDKLVTVLSSKLKQTNKQQTAKGQRLWCLCSQKGEPHFLEHSNCGLLDMLRSGCLSSLVHPIFRVEKVPVCFNYEGDFTYLVASQQNFDYFISIRNTNRSTS